VVILYCNALPLVRAVLLTLYQNVVDVCLQSIHSATHSYLNSSSDSNIVNGVMPNITYTDRSVNYFDTYSTPAIQVQPTQRTELPTQ
jgi:hypothetical protein